ncbi:MAG: hypothetical protein BroJett040_00670 [Oligoflexia bacterium]|nr:MAG: hypothetical protein BroJett040_00670 [Oligoflexia bacterium]
MEKIKVEMAKYPKLVSDLASQNYYLKVLSYSLIGLTTLIILAFVYLLKQGPQVIALDPGGTVANVGREMHDQHVQAAIKEYLNQRYVWNSENVQEKLKKAEAFVLPSLVPSFQKNMIEVQKFVRERKVSQRVYPHSIEVSLKEKVAIVSADRITEFDTLKAATVLKTKLYFDLDQPTSLNPWGIYFTKEVEGGESQ